MARASVTKFITRGKLLIHPLSTLKMGGAIGTPPYYWIDANDPLEKIVEVIKLALNDCKSDLETPDWDESMSTYLKET